MVCKSWYFSLGIPDLPVNANWYPGGPSFSMFPYPVLDKTRGNCTSCIGMCHGHYVTNLESYKQIYSDGCAIRASPPSEILAEFFEKENTLEPTGSQLNKLKNMCLLPADEIKLYLQHLATVSANRKEGAKKRKKK